MGLPIVQGTVPLADDFNLFQPCAHDGANVADYLDSMRPMTALVQLDEYSGAANCVRMIVSENVLFYKRDDNDITSASNPDGSVRIDQLGRRWKRLQGDVTQAVEKIAGEALASAQLAEAEKLQAQTAKTDAEAARDQAILASVTAGAYPNSAATSVPAGVALNAYYWVASADGLYLDLYRNVASVATNVAPSIRVAQASVFASLQALIREEYTELYAYTIRDPAGRVAFGVKNDGTVVLATLNGLTTDGITAAIAAAQALAQVAADKTAAFTTLTGVAPAYTINDAMGRTAFEIAADGTISVASLKVAKINGGDALALRAGYGGTFDGEKVFMLNSGQSLAGGGGPAITKTQEYDNLGFRAGVVDSGTPTAYYPLTAANCSQNADMETPMFGMLGYLKALIEQENGITYTAQNYQLVGADNSHGSWAIDAFSKSSAAGSLYNAALLQAAALKSMAAAENQTFAVGSVTWTQGESDEGNGYAYYLGKLKTLALNYDTDFKAISGQTRATPFIVGQMSSARTNRDVALAQFQASVDLPSLIYVSTPMYQFDYLADGVHLTADSYRWYGGYPALVHKRVVVDKLPWTVTRPISAVVSGKFVNVKFAMNARPLVLDAALVPQQVNYGFTLVDSAGNNLPIASVSLVGPEHLKVVAVSAIPAGAFLCHGYNTAVGKGGFLGGCGNLRDSMGDTVPLHNNRPLHGWAAIFKFPL